MAAILISGTHFIGGCNTVDTVNVPDFNEFCRHFVKAISTRDTAVFNSSTDKESICSHFLQKYPSEKALTPDNVSWIFFFKFSPWVIRNDHLLALKSKENFFESFTTEIIQQSGASRVDISVTWKESISDAKSEHLYLLLRRVGDSWKVIGVDW